MRQLRRSELVSILIALVMLLAIGIFSGLDWREYRTNRSEVLASRLIFEHSTTLSLALAGAEASQRGYLLTGDPSYLDVWESAVRGIPAELATLDHATAQDAPMNARVRRLRAATAALLDEAGRTIELRKRGDVEGSLAIVRAGRGKALMDSIRAITGEIHGKERDFIGRRSNTVMNDSDRSHFVTIAGSLLLLVLLGMGAFHINQATRRREQLIADLGRERNQTGEVRDLLQTTLASIADAVLVTGPQGRITFLNQVAESLTGWSAAEAQGKLAEEVFRIVDEITRMPGESPVAAVLAAGKAVGFPAGTVLVRKDGSEIPIDDSGAPIRGHAGEVLGVVLVFRDVTGRRAGERERERLLAEAQRSRADAERQRSHLHSLFLQAPAMINIHRGPDHVFELVHPLTTELLGGRPVAGLTAREALPGSEYAERLDAVFRAGRPDAIPEMPVVAAMPDGGSKGIFLNCVFCPWRGPEGNVAGVMTLAIDITAQVRARQALEATQERLRETAKLESLGVLAGGIAHDFNNLLVGIMGNASLAHELLPPSAPARELIENTIRASEKAAALTRQMLAYSGKGRFVLTPVNLSELVEEMLPLIRSSIPRSVAVRTSLAGDLPLLEGDCPQLQQVFMNLAINAAEACGAEGGEVTIATSQLEVDGRRVRAAFGLPEPAPGAYVALVVADTGCGMDEATKEKVFDPFFTTKFTGRGLGLSAVLGIIRAHQGAITVESEPGRGSTFQVLFPAARNLRPMPAEVPALRRQTGTGSILVVDDEEIVRSMARAALEHLGYTVLEAANGETAVRLFRARSHRIDAVILDLTMPLMGGETALRHLKAIDAHVPVILSSGFDEAEATMRFNGDDLAGFLKKPYDAAILAAQVRAALSGRTVSAD